MTTLREAAQQALEALEAIDKDFKSHGRQHWPEAVKSRAAISALRAALEQYDKDRVRIEEMKANWALQRKLAEETQERDKQRMEYEAALADGDNLSPTGCDHCNHPLYAAIKCWSCGRVTE